MERLEPRRPNRDASHIFRHPILSTTELSALAPEEKKHLIEDTALDAMTHLSKAGYKEYESIDAMFRDLSVADFIVRRESPARLLDSVKNHAPLSIHFPEGTRYSNAVEWDPTFRIESMNNAFFEGYGMANGIVTVMGSVRRETLDVQKLPDAQRDFYGLNREAVVSVAGEVPADDIAFAMVRIPIYAFPLEMMTDHERDIYEEWDEKRHHAREKRVEPKFIYRGYINPKYSRQTSKLH